MYSDTVLTALPYLTRYEMLFVGELFWKGGTWIPELAFMDDVFDLSLGEQLQTSMDPKRAEHHGPTPVNRAQIRPALCMFFGPGRKETRRQVSCSGFDSSIFGHLDPLGLVGPYS